MVALHQPNLISNQRMYISSFQLIIKIAFQDIKKLIKLPQNEIKFRIEINHVLSIGANMLIYNLGLVMVDVNNLEYFR